MVFILYGTCIKDMILAQLSIVVLLESSVNRLDKEVTESNLLFTYAPHPQARLTQF